MVKRLALARKSEDPLCTLIQNSGWEPVPFFLTRMEPSNEPPPIENATAIILLSPTGAKFAKLPEGIPILVTGEGTARTLPERDVWISPEPRAEGLWALMRERFPEGGDFLLVRGERSRGFLEEVSFNTPWRVHPWTTHAENPWDPPPPMPSVDAVLALSPLQAELLAPRASALLRFAWGERAAQAFAILDQPAHDTCEPRPESLGRMLKQHR